MNNLWHVLCRPLLFIDFETTGVDPTTAGVTEVAGSKHWGDGSIDRFRCLINPQKEIPEEVVKLTGITNEMVSGGPIFEDVFNNVLSRLLVDNPIIVAHNAIYDITVLKSQMSKMGIQPWSGDTVCTMTLAALLYKGKESLNKIGRPYTSYKLFDVCEVLGYKLEGAHRAENDIIATEFIFNTLWPLAEEKGIEFVNVLAHRSWAPVPDYIPENYTLKYIK